MCMVRYTGGIQCQFWYGKTALGHRNGLSVRIYGEKAGAEWVQAHPEELYLALQNGDKLIVDRAAAVSVAHEARYNRFKAGHPSGFLEAFANLYHDIATDLEFYRHDESGASGYVYSVDHALEGMRLLESIEVSQKNRQWVEIDA